MYPLLHRILVVFYTLLPPLALVTALAWGRRRRTAAPVASFLVTCLSGVLLGTCVDVVYVTLVRGHITPVEIVRTWYFLISLLSTVGLFRGVLRFTVVRLLRVDPTCRTFGSRLRAAFASSVQVIILFGLGLPYVVGTMLVHRVHVTRSPAASSVASSTGERVTFTTDGLALAAWWVPANAAPTRFGADFAPRDKTVVMCGGLGDDLLDAEGLVRILVADGYNVLYLNPRGHDGSDGRWTTFGDLERRDVLAAVRWARATHPFESRSVKGVGIGIGGAAMIAAATDGGDEGQAIDSVAVFGAYANFRTLAANLFTPKLPASIREWVLNVTIPIASAHAGTDLERFSPAALAPKLWPRPLLIVEARGDRVFPPTEGETLAREATFPKRTIWVPGGHADLFHNADAARGLLNFFSSVPPTPAI